MEKYIKTILEVYMEEKKYMICPECHWKWALSDSVDWGWWHSGGWGWSIIVHMWIE